MPSQQSITHSTNGELLHSITLIPLSAHRRLGKPSKLVLNCYDLKKGHAIKNLSSFLKMLIFHSRHSNASGVKQAIWMNLTRKISACAFGTFPSCSTIIQSLRQFNSMMSSATISNINVPEQNLHS